jgi:transposase-like protein
VVSGAFRLEPAVTQPIERDALYRRRRFPRDVIETCVRWYLTYRLSYRDLVALMAERDVALAATEHVSTAHSCDPRKSCEISSGRIYANQARICA